MITKSALTIIFTLICLLGTGVLCQDKHPTQEPALLTFADLQRGDVGERPFRIEGFVLQTYKCPPCPPRMMCKPCVGDHIVITDNLDEQDPSAIKHLRIFTDKPEQFELKKKYSFTVRIRGKVPTGRAVQDVDLISFEVVEEDG